MTDEQIAEARRKIVLALADHATLPWTVSTKNASACIDGLTFIVVLIFNIDAGRWVTSVVDIVDGKTDTVRWGQDPKLPIDAAESWVRS